MMLYKQVRSNNIQRKEAAKSQFNDLNVNYLKVNEVKLNGLEQIQRT